MLQPIGQHQNGHGHAEAATGHAHPAPRLPSTGLNLKQHVQQVELNLIRQALDRTHGVVADAARLLCLRRTTLVEKLRKYRGLNYRFDVPHAA